MDIQVWSDLVCPWSYIGRRRLEKALDGLTADVRVTFRAYQLDRMPVPDPLPTKQALAQKFGGAARAERMLARVAAVAAGDGLELNFDRAIAANTFDAHRLVAWAAGQGRQIDMIDALQRAHFTDGVDIGSRMALATVSASIGLDGRRALAYLDADGGIQAVADDLAEARELGISSVPTFVVDYRYAIRGAQEPATLRAALAEIARRQVVDTRR